jgi:hypothetical protein
MLNTVNANAKHRENPFNHPIRSREKNTPYATVKNQTIDRKKNTHRIPRSTGTQETSTIENSQPDI